ncbi:VirK family protein [Legionella maioricensis]|uniref:VirK family protein n=1 Tax=Legionella maioricensis TaxID=2896528 RepID=A0A9X2CYF3_9GAMM|nr:VirK family protein [Legionella maioricensis]MCL9682542.1 VirK family protein [Legionella maioricensis]MCL9686211.1 VirK family protein [Legionella maioricensis]
MKKIVLSVFTLFSFAVHADELSTFNDIASVVAEGKPVTFVINFKECRSQMPLPLVSASITPNAVMIVANKRITASDRHFTLDDPIAPGTPVFDYSKFNIDSEGGASIKMTMMNASNYEVLVSHLIHCELGEGFKVFG